MQTTHCSCSIKNFKHALLAINFHLLKKRYTQNMLIRTLNSHTQCITQKLVDSNME